MPNNKKNGQVNKQGYKPSFGAFNGGKQKFIHEAFPYEAETPPKPKLIAEVEKIPIRKSDGRNNPDGTLKPLETFRPNPLMRPKIKPQYTQKEQQEIDDWRTYTQQMNCAQNNYEKYQNNKW